MARPLHHGLLSVQVQRAANVVGIPPAAAWQAGRAGWGMIEVYLGSEGRELKKVAVLVWPSSLLAAVIICCCASFFHQLCAAKSSTALCPWSEGTSFLLQPAAPCQCVQTH